MYSIKQLGVKPETAIFVGDSLRSDILRAKEAGMQTVFFGKIGEKMQEQIDFSASSVTELETLLDALLGID